MVRDTVRMGSWACLLAVLAGAAGRAAAGEVLDNPKLIKMLENGISLPVLKDKFGEAECRFSSDSDQLIEVSGAAKKGGYGKQETDELLQIIIKKAGEDKKRLAELAVRFLNVCVNADQQEYDAMMRTLLREGKALVPHLLRYIEDEQELKRKGLLDALGRLGDKSENVVRSVRLMVGDRHPAVRAQAARTVAALAVPGTAAELIEALEKRKGDYLDGVCMALGFLGDAKAVGPLTDVLKRATDKDGRLAAAFALGLLRAREKEAVEALLAAVLDDQDPRLRAAAARACALIGEPRTVRTVIRAYQRFQESGKQGNDELLRALETFRSQEAIEFLIHCANDDSPAIRKAATETLRILTGETYETQEEWEAWWQINRDRPDWLRPEGAPAPAPKKE